MIEIRYIYENSLKSKKIDEKNIINEINNLIKNKIEIVKLIER